MSFKSVLVSVIVPVYNSDKFIKECLDSILNQDFENFEVLVSDDASTDESRDILKKYECINNFKIFYQALNLGITKNCNFLLERAKGKYVCFFAGDDIMLPGKIGKQFSFMEGNSNYSFSHHSAEIFDSESGKKILNTNENPKHAIKHVKSLITEMGVSAPMSIMARQSMLPSNFFNSEFNYVSDWLMQIEMAMNGDIGYMDEILCKYRKYGNNNGKDISSYEHEFLSVLDFVSKKYPELCITCSSGKSRYLVGKSFRVGDSSQRREILKLSLKLKFSFMNIAILLISYAPFSKNIFIFMYKRRYSLKGFKESLKIF